MSGSQSSPRPDRADDMDEAEGEDEFNDDLEAQPLLPARVASFADQAMTQTPSEKRRATSYCGPAGSARRVSTLDGSFADIIQFSAPMYYAEEDKGEIIVEVIRLGNLRGTCSARFYTHDVTAKSGEQYEESGSALTFEDGEHSKEITIKILEDGKWTPSTEFKISLTDPEECTLGMALFVCRVKILNEDAWPSEAYREAAEAGKEALGKVGDWGLFWNYCQFNYTSAGVKKATVLTLLLDQMSNVALFVTLWVGVYMVDTVFARGSTTSKKLLVDDRYHMAVVLATWYVIPVVVLYTWDAVKVHMDIRGTSRRYLQACMMRTYLQYTAESQSRVSPTDLTVTMAQNGDSVARSYVAALTIVQCVGKILAVEMFILWFQPDMLAICSVVAMPFLLVVFLSCYIGVFQKHQLKVDNCMRILMMLSNDACVKYRLVAEYFRRSVMCEVFDKSAEEHTEAMIPETYAKLNALYVTKFLSGCFIAIYIISKAQFVLDGELSLGLFLATITIFGTYLADAITDLNLQLNIIIESFTSLQEFTLYFNMPLELSALNHISAERRSTTAKYREELMAKGLKEGNVDMESATDAIPITATNLAITTRKGVAVFHNVNISAEQGRMIAVVGPHSCGKKILLELMADLLLPTAGSIFVPSHLRVLHVSREPMFLRMSLSHNLTLGLANQHRVDFGRVQKILKMFGLDEMATVMQNETTLCNHRKSVDLAGDTHEKVDLGDAVEMAEPNPNVTAWLEHLSHSQRAKLHLARALIANPNVLILQRPLHHFNEEVGSQILEVLRQHVTLRGLGYSEHESADTRRPRTVFFIPENEAQAERADTIWRMDKVSCSVIGTSNSPRSLAPSPRSPAPKVDVERLSSTMGKIAQRLSPRGPAPKVDAE